MGRSGSRTTIQNIQLANSDVISFHSYAGPSTFESRIGELTPHGPPSCAPNTCAVRGSTIESILPLPSGTIWCDQLGFGAVKPQTYFRGTLEPPVFIGPEGVVPRSAAAGWNCLPG